MHYLFIVTRILNSPRFGGFKNGEAYKFVGPYVSVAHGLEFLRIICLQINASIYTKQA